MLDVNIPSGESWIRQVLYGKGYYRRTLNVDVTTGWALDTLRPPCPNAATAETGGL